MTNEMLSTKYMGLRNFIHQLFSKKEEETCALKDTQCIADKSQYALPNDNINIPNEQQDLILFVCKLGDDAFPSTFPLILNNMDNRIKGLIAILPLELEGTELVKLALDEIMYVSSSFDFIITIDPEQLHHKNPQVSLQMIFRYTEELVLKCAECLLCLNKITSIESTLKRNWGGSAYRRAFPKLDFGQLLQSGILTITQTSKKFCSNKDGLLVGTGMTGGEIVEKIYFHHKRYYSDYTQERLRVLRLGLLHKGGTSPYLDLLGIGGNVGVGFDHRPQFYKKIVTTNSKTIQKCLIEMLIGTNLPLSTLTEEIIPYIAYGRFY